MGIETSRFKTTLALRAGDYLGVVIALRQLGMTVDVETDATCIDIEQLVLRAAIQTESNGGQHHKHSGEAGRAGRYCCNRRRYQCPLIVNARVEDYCSCSCQRNWGVLGIEVVEMNSWYWCCDGWRPDSRRRMLALNGWRCDKK